MRAEIGISEPLSIYINTFGTSKHPDSFFINLIKKHFNLTPRGIIDTLNLKNTKYLDTAAYGHFGRKDKNFSWENLDMASRFT